MAVRSILLLGDPRLYELSTPVEQGDVPTLRSLFTDLRDTVTDFRSRYGKGRAIAAPQVGIAKRIIVMHADRTIVFLNPQLENAGQETFELWDDCMSFPGLLVKVKRHRRCVIRYRDQDWQEQRMELTDDLSELLQHEYDHLDGILATMRAIDSQSFKIDPAIPFRQSTNATVLGQEK